MDGAVSSQQGRAGTPPQLVLATLLMGAEALLAAVLAVILVVDIFVQTADSLPTAIALAVLAVLGAVWAVSITIGLARRRAWTRAAGIVWQLLQAAVGIGALQGAFAAPAWGWPLVIASALGLILLASRRTGDALGVAERHPGG